MFRKKGIVYLSKTHISLYYKDIVNPLRVDFEKNILDHATNSDKEWLRNSIKALENKVKLRRLKAVLILSKDLVFDKIIEDEDLDKRTLEINEFLAGLPIGVGLVEDREFVKEGNVLVTATNKNLYESFIDILKPLNIDIDYVLPEIVFNRVEFNKTFLDEVFRERVLLKFGNFLEQQESPLNMTRNKILAVIGICILIGGLLGSVFYFTQNSELVAKLSSIKIETTSLGSDSNTNTVETNNESNAETNSDSSNIVTVNKDEITISVLNGTGIPGFAGEIGTIIGNLGYKNLTTANANNFNYTNTVIEIDEILPLSIVEEIRTSLKGKLKSFEIKQSKDLSKRIVITTGEVVQN